MRACHEKTSVGSTHQPDTAGLCRGSLVARSRAPQRLSARVP